MLSHVLNAEIFNNLLKVLRDLFATPEYKILAYFDLALHTIQANHFAALYCCVNSSNCETWKSGFALC